MIAYSQLEVGFCIGGVHYDVRGMKRMISDDRYLIVNVGVDEEAPTASKRSPKKT